MDFQLASPFWPSSASRAHILLAPRRYAVPACPEDGQFVLQRMKPFRHEIIQTGNASRQFEKLPAVPAQEMMVVRLACTFVTARLSNQFHLDQLIAAKHLAQMPIDCRDAKPGKVDFGFGMQFESRQWGRMRIQDGIDVFGLFSFPHKVQSSLKLC